MNGTIFRTEKHDVDFLNGGEKGFVMYSNPNNNEFCL